ncbi:MAG TPA: peroxiredoxin [Ktedonobacterales bacterium]
MNLRQETATIQTQRRVGVGDMAPDFALPNGSGEVVRLSDFRGKKDVVLYFYPKDNSAGCTAEACAFRDRYDVISDMDAEVIGVSGDSPASHNWFATQHRLPFQLLSDEHGVARKSYGVPASFGFLPGRVTYVIDKQGVIRNVFTSQLNIDKHVAQALSTLRTLYAGE